MRYSLGHSPSASGCTPMTRPGPDPSPPLASPVITRDDRILPSSKRKRGFTESPLDFKRFKPADASHPVHLVHKLPLQLWQAIFKFCPLPTLFRISRVNHDFRRCLLETQEHHNDGNTSAIDYHPVYGFLPTIKPNEIWSSSWQLHLPPLPDPIPGLNERQMLTILINEFCQFCGKNSSVQQGDMDDWNQGPGDSGARIIWPFGIRSCGLCLRDRVQNVANSRSLILRYMTNPFTGMVASTF